MSEISQLADELVALRFEAYPFDASLLGAGWPGESPSAGPHHRLPDYSEDARQRSKDGMLAIARAATAVDAATLTASERVTREVIVQQACALAADIEVRPEEFSVSDGLSSPALWPLVALPMIELVDLAMADGFLERLNALPAYLAALQQRQRVGLEQGLAPPAFLVRSGIAFLDRYLSAAVDPLTQIEPQVEFTGFAEQRAALVADRVRPAYRRYRAFLADEVLPAARQDGQAGLWWQPDGEHRYAALVNVHTTTERDAAELHDTGLDLLAKIADEYAEVGGAVFGTTSIEAIFDRMRHDPALRWSGPDEVLAAARAAIDRAKAAAPSWFGRLPAATIDVRPVPEAEADGGSLAYYTPPSLDGTRPGTYFTNTTRADQRFKYLAEAIAFHEAIPGHHLQITSALALDDLPMLRRIADVNAYAEGWGLYAERLADEIGLYSGQLDRLGMLAQDSMRAARLVVDTGLHARGWSRQRAVDFLTEHTPMAQVEIESEVDRYAAVPGQALSYMVGRLEIQRMRALAQSALGQRFDIAEFHDVLLGNGPLPLPVLATVVGEWTQAKAAG